MTRQDDAMREPHTPSETSLLSPPLKAAWLEVVAPPRDARARLWTELAKTTLGATPSETVARVDRAMSVRALGAPLAQVRHWLLAKWIATCVLLTGVVAALLIAQLHTAPASTRSSARASTPQPAALSAVIAPALPSPSVTAAAPDPLPMPTPRKPEATSKRAKPRPRAAAVASPEPAATPAAALEPPRAVPVAPQHDLANDLKLLRRAESALVANDPAGALRLLDRHDALYANSALSKEKAALRIMAGCALGQPQARAQRDAFLLAERHSPLGARVRDACAGLR